MGDGTVPWVPNAERPACAACNRRFGFARRRHHCRACGDVFCASCGPKRALRALAPHVVEQLSLALGSAAKKKHSVRVCAPCATSTVPEAAASSSLTPVRRVDAVPCDGPPPPEPPEPPPQPAETGPAVEFAAGGTDAALVAPVAGQARWRHAVTTAVALAAALLGASALRALRAKPRGLLGVLVRVAAALLALACARRTKAARAPPALPAPAPALPAAPAAPALEIPDGCEDALPDAGGYRVPAEPPAPYAETVAAAVAAARQALRLDGDWEDRGCVRGVQVHACRGQPLVRGEIVLPCGVRPIFDVIAVPDGVKREQEMDEGIESIQRLGWLNEQTWVSLSKYYGRAFVAPREFLNINHWRVEPDGTVLVCAKSLPAGSTFDGRAPPPGTGASRGTVRGDLRVGAWCLQPLGPAEEGGPPRTKVVYTASLDLHLPDVIMTRVLNQQPLQVTAVLRVLQRQPHRIHDAARKPPLSNTGQLASADAQ